jgi:hypothetical protein
MSCRNVIVVSFRLLPKGKMKNDRPIIPPKCYWINDYVMMNCRQGCLRSQAYFGRRYGNQKRP